jgi:hypothetical protein
MEKVNVLITSKFTGILLTEFMRRPIEEEHPGPEMININFLIEECIPA